VKDLHANEDFSEINETLLTDLMYGEYNLICRDKSLLRTGYFPLAIYNRGQTC
jgi:hypothetical protein